eukprot:1322026-Prymnesium_polylepis.3
MAVVPFAIAAMVYALVARTYPADRDAVAGKLKGHTSHVHGPRGWSRWEDKEGDAAVHMYKLNCRVGGRGA